MFKFNFNFWDSLVWPLVTNMIWIFVLVYLYKMWIELRRKKYISKLDDFHEFVSELYNNENKDFDKEATSHVNENLIKFAKFLSVVGNENIDNKEKKSDWNNNNRLNKFRQFFFYLDGENSVAKFRESSMTESTEKQKSILNDETKTWLHKYGTWRAIAIIALLVEFIYLGFWIIPSNIEVKRWESFAFILVNVVIFLIVNNIFRIYKKTLLPLIEYSPLVDDKGHIDQKYVKKVNEYRKNVNLVVNIEVIVTLFLFILFCMSLVHPKFFIIASEQLKYVSIATVAPMLLFALKADYPLDDIYWIYATENYKEYMKKILK